MSASTGPAADVEVDAALVVALLRAQHPDLAALEVRPVRAGWDNAVFRIGDALCARLPRRAVAAPLAAAEQRWLPVLAPRLPLPVPRPVRVGTPGCGYPYAWTVVPWFAGSTLADASGAAGVADAGPANARRLGRFLRALHVGAPADAPRNPARGVALAARRAITVTQSPTSEELDAFDAHAAGPVHDAAPVWVHGDLHPRNVLVDASGAIVAVLDLGDLTAGDPATDLAIGWMCFGEASRRAFFAAAGASDPTIRRARAWAIALAIAYRHGAADDPWFAALARRTLAAAS